MLNKERHFLVKYAELEKANPGLLKSFSNFSSRNPYLTGGLGAGAAALGLSSILGGGRGSTLSTLGTLGLLGGGGLLLDRVGGLDGLSRNWRAYQNFRKIYPEAEIGGIGGAIDKFNWFNNLPTSKQEVYANPNLPSFVSNLGGLKPDYKTLFSKQSVPPVTSPSRPAVDYSTIPRSMEEAKSRFSDIKGDVTNAYDNLDTNAVKENFGKGNWFGGVRRGWDAFQNMKELYPDGEVGGFSGAVDKFNKFYNLDTKQQEFLGSPEFLETAKKLPDVLPKF